MNNKSEAKRIFITGGASGLGRSIALRYARAGWRVGIADRNDQRGAETRAKLEAVGAEALYVHCDVTSEDDLARAAELLVSSWAGVDVVVNNAGVAQAGAIEDVSIEDWQWIVDINLMGVVRGCKVFTPLFKRQGHGHFVNVASMAGLLDVPLMSSYNASKAAVVSLSETLQNELASHGIKVTLVCPSFFRTNLGESMRSNSPQLRSIMDKLMARGRITADQIADAVFEAVNRERFHLLPHSDARLIWMLKRMLPRKLYAAMMLHNTRRLRHAA